MIDVRSSPYSAYHTQYNKEQLSHLLSQNQIKYRNYAREFGARQENHRFYPNGFLDFSIFTKSPQFMEGVHKIESAIAYRFTPVLMCAEKEPSVCHRSIMIGRELSRLRFDVVHILPGGAFKTQNQIEHELLDHYYPNRNQITMFDLPRSDDELIEDAYYKRNQEIAFEESALAL